MARHIRWFIIFTVILVFSSIPAFAQGVILPPPGVDTNASTLSFDYLRIKTTIDNQIAHTNIDMQFTNNGDRLAEGTYVFPLPAEAAVDELIMYIDGQAIESKLLPAGEAREIYNEIVRQLRDPALLEYVGTNAIQANVFPIPPGESRRLEIAYTEVLTADNGLVHYVLQMHSAGNETRSIGQMSISVEVNGDEAISSVYSPSHRVALTRTDESHFRTGYEANNVIPDNDFSLYYGLANQDININLLTYRESADQDGFFMLLVQPPERIDDTQILPKDVIIVLDQSGSMEGDKWTQGQAAAQFVLDNLNPQDRFNVIPFSTGWRMFSNGLTDASNAQGAISWIDSLYAEGGTDINGALSTALDMVEDRPTTILFLTDGLATEGTTETSEILENLNSLAPDNARIFSFGVGDDVDTFLLDAIVRDFNGTGSYVRPSERIDEEVAALYKKISSPVLTDVTLEIDGVVAELMYPKTLSDLFAGEQLTIVGRYRGASEGQDIRLNGVYNGIPETYIYADQTFPENAGGQSFIPRLWATRRIGDLLNAIRLNGESEELVDAVVDLSIRYGIITPYTSFLIEEDDILSQLGRERAQDDFAGEAQNLAATSTGAGAVDAADTSLSMADAEAPAASSAGFTRTESEEEKMSYDANDKDGRVDNLGGLINPIQTVDDKTFILQDDIWTDTTFEPDTMETATVIFLSDAYFDLIDEHPELGEYFAVGEQVIVVIDGTAYEVVLE